MNFFGLLNFTRLVLNRVFPVLVGLAVFVIIWGIFKFIVHAGDEEERKKGRAALLWGVIGAFCMLSVWGLVNILYNTIYLDRTIFAPSPIVNPAATCMQECTAQRGSNPVCMELCKP